MFSDVCSRTPCKNRWQSLPYHFCYRVSSIRGIKPIPNGKTLDASSFQNRQGTVPTRMQESPLTRVYIPSRDSGSNRVPGHPPIDIPEPIITSMASKRQFPWQAGAASPISRNAANTILDGLRIAWTILMQDSYRFRDPRQTCNSITDRSSRAAGNLRQVRTKVTPPTDHHDSIAALWQTIIREIQNPPIDPVARTPEDTQELEESGIELKTRNILHHECARRKISYQTAKVEHEGISLIANCLEFVTATNSGKSLAGRAACDQINHVRWVTHRTNDILTTQHAYVGNKQSSLRMVSKKCFGPAMVNLHGDFNSKTRSAKSKRQPSASGEQVDRPQWWLPHRPDTHLFKSPVPRQKRRPSRHHLPPSARSNCSDRLTASALRDCSQSATARRKSSSPSVGVMRSSS